MRMTSPFRAIALTLFPEMFPGPLGVSLAGKALEKGIWSLKTLNIRDFTHDKHSTVDASPYGGGTGMVMKPDVLHEAIEHAKTLIKTPLPLREGLGGGVSSSSVIRHPSSESTPHPNPPPQGGKETKLIYFTPRGVPMTQKLVEECSKSDLILLCGRFEGIDQRVIDHHEMLEVSLGDFILSGGEIAALALLDACVRLLPGVIGNENAIHEESFASTSNYSGLLEYPHYTRPSHWNGRHVPEVLLSGNHEHISEWRLEQARNTTKARRPDLWEKIMDERSED